MDNSADVSRSLKVSDRRRNTPAWAHNRSESLCAGLRVPCWIFWSWFGPASGPNPVGNRRFLAGSFKVFGALFTQPRKPLMYLTFRLIFCFCCRILADPGIVRDGSGTSFLGPRDRFRAPGRGFWTHQNNNTYLFLLVPKWRVQVWADFGRKPCVVGREAGPKRPGPSAWDPFFARPHYLAVLKTGYLTGSLAGFLGVRF